ncbi:type III secretion system chaperone [Thalassoglobus sp. JC818]|uniref:type III secretion system chaperone n=1 Tax=Thalassoglobus sp. JC818 TaxID=3232136 RepID=UPI003457AFC1
MITLEQLRMIIAESGPLLRAVHVEALDESSFLVAIDEDCIIRIDYDPKTCRLVLSSRLGTVGMMDRLEIYEQLLRYNFLWNHTGGVKVSLDSTDDDLVQSYEHFVRHLNVTEFCQLVTGFQRKVRVWQKLILSSCRIQQNCDQQIAIGEEFDTSGCTTEALRV